MSLATASYLMPHRRAEKRIKNRLAKKGLEFIRFEQNDRQLITMRVILQTRREKLGRAFVYPLIFLRKSSPRVIADAVLSDYLRGYGRAPI